MAALLCTATVLGANPGITIANLRTDRGKVLWMLREANGKSQMGIEQPAAGKATIVPEAISADSATLYAFLDENGNYTLDRNADGMPAEGCCTRTIRREELGDSIRVELRYEFGRNARKEAPEQVPAGEPAAK